MQANLPITATEAAIDTAVRQVQQGARLGLCEVSAIVVDTVAVRSKAAAVAKALGTTVEQLDWSCDLFTRSAREDQVLTVVSLRSHGITVQRRRPSASSLSGLMHITVRNGRAW